MKTYVAPKFNAVEFSDADVVRTSTTGAGYVETTSTQDNDFGWGWEE